MEKEYTVTELIRALTEMKKKGLGNSKVKLESCDGCVGTAKGSLKESKSSTGEKSVLISQ
jgi:hypothetical protein